MTIDEALVSGLIPIEYSGIFPRKCRCGADIEVNEILTKMWCPSEKCTSKQIARMDKMLTAFGVKDIGESYCRELWYEMERCGLGDSHMNVFLLPFDEYPSSHSIEVTLKKFTNIQNVIIESHFNGGYTLGEIVSKMSLPGLDTNARKMFAGFSSIREMKAYANRNFYGRGVRGLVCDRFGYGVMADKVMHTLATFCTDIVIAQKLFTIRKSVPNEIKISITGRISLAGTYTRKEFLKYVNKLCDGVAEIIDVAPSSQIEWVVADDSSDSSTYYYGEENDLLITSRDFVDWLKSEVLE